MDFSNMIPANGVRQHVPQPGILQQRQLSIILQQQQYILKQQQQIIQYQQQQRYLELEQQFQELVWELQQLAQQPPQLSPQEQAKLQPLHQDVLYQQQQVMHKQRIELHVLQQQHQWLTSQQQLPISHRNKPRRGSAIRTAWCLDKCRSQMSQNVTGNTMLNDKSVMNIINEHSALVNFIDNKFKEFTGPQSMYGSGNLIEKLKTIIRIAGEMSCVHNETADNRNEPDSPVIEPEVILDYVKEIEAPPEMALTATFQDNGFLSHKDIRSYAEHYRVSRAEDLSWCEQQQNERKDNSRRQIESDEGLDTFKIKFPGPSC